MLLNVSNDYLYTDTGIESIGQSHRPYFLALGGHGERTHLTEVLKAAGVELGSRGETIEGALGHIIELGDVEEYQSFSRPGKKVNVFKVFTDQSRYVPEVSTGLFLKHGLFTAEHDIPYVQRAASDLAAEGTWLLDSKGDEKTLKVLAYDIETPNYEKETSRAKVEIIGLTQFDVTFRSSHDLENEEFTIDIDEIHGSWDTDEVIQLESKAGQNEPEQILTFIEEVKNSHIITGHNILSFDNHHLYNRIKSFDEGEEGILSEHERQTFKDFRKRYARPVNYFTYGRKSLGVNFYPISLDTYHAALQFYRFLDSFDLKSLATFFGINIEGREYIAKSEMTGVDWKRLMDYSRHDVQEQAGLTRIMLQQTLPLAFVTGMPVEDLLSSGATKVWDYMTFIRGAKHKKIIPPTCRAHGASASILRLLKKRGIEDANSVHVKDEIVGIVRGIGNEQHIGTDDSEVDKELMRVVKYGEEMPDWVNYPYLAFNSRRMGDGGGDHGYHLPGGMTIQPGDVGSDFIPWWHMIVADVGAMYPTILKGMNACADTVMVAKKGEKPDDWVWLKQITEDFLERDDILARTVAEIEDEKYADKGHFIGIKIASSQGLVNRAMTGILSLIFKIKSELKVRKEAGLDTTTLQMMYNSVKGMRNAGTHGILVASNVSCRQFNLWGGAMITTTGQRMLQDAMDELEKLQMRVVYGDTDGIYVGCARSSGSLPEVCRAFETDVTKGDYLSDPDDVLKAIQYLNDRWREKLDYQEFELEPEYADAMLFVKHKNYLIWNARDGKLKMATKGNNFKGSDKAPIARKVLQDIMFKVLKEHQSWTRESEVKESIRRSITRHTLDIVKILDLSNVDKRDLTLIQKVRPPKQYKERGGAESALAIRARALGKLMGKEIRTSSKFRFLVLKIPLKGISDPKKSGIRPIDYMWPVDMVHDDSNIDLDWYREMIINYVKGAFGLREMEETVQVGLDSFV